MKKVLVYWLVMLALLACLQSSVFATITWPPDLIFTGQTAWADGQNNSGVILTKMSSSGTLWPYGNPPVSNTWDESGDQFYYIASAQIGMWNAPQGTPNAWSGVSPLYSYRNGSYLGAHNTTTEIGTLIPSDIGGYYYFGGISGFLGGGHSAGYYCSYDKTGITVE